MFGGLRRTLRLAIPCHQFCRSLPQFFSSRVLLPRLKLLDLVFAPPLDGRSTRSMLDTLDRPPRRFLRSVFSMLLGLNNLSCGWRVQLNHVQSKTHVDSSHVQVLDAFGGSDFMTWCMDL